MPSITVTPATRAATPAARRLHKLSLTALAVLTAAITVAPASAQPRQHRFGAEENSFRVRLGQFDPEADSEYWNDTFDVFDSSANQFEDISFGGDFVLALGPKSAIMFSADVYEGKDDSAYLDFVDSFGSPIVHSTRLTIASATAAYVVSLAGRQSRLVPYLGVGGGVYDWELEEEGDFIDFGVVPLEIFNDRFVSGNTVLGWYWLAGLEVPVGPRWSVFVEGRWQRVDDSLEGDFADFGTIDLSGRHVYGGFAWSF